jgi:Protein of unknown function (DUF2934)
MATRRSVETPASAENRARTTQPKGTRARGTPAASRASVLAEDRRAMIAQAAYLRAERRGFDPGHETEDWLAAEEEVDALLALGQGGPAQ